MANTDAAGSEQEPVYYEVVLAVRKDLYGFTYRPGITHVVDEATLEAFGDAVESKKLKAKPQE
jgi:hypothetical protein